MSFVRAKKFLGQHWLHDHAALEAMCAAGQVNSQDVVLEIGPGLGSLTNQLVKHAKRVIAVEFDEDLARALMPAVQARNLEVIQHDILTFDFTSLPPDYKIVANIPYYLTSHLLRVLSETTNAPLRIALLVQKEVAERVCAQPGEMSVLTVTAQFFFEASLGRVVEAALFSPPPKVDSQILILQRRPKLLFPDVDPKTFFRIVKAGFGERRKKLSNSLSGGLHISKEAATDLLERAEIDPNLRAQNLSLEQWYNLYQVFDLDKS